MAASLLPNGEQQFIDGNGVPYAGGSVYFYIPNTATPKNTWQNSGETILNTNPVILDAAGRAIIYGDGDYRQVLQDSLGNTVWDQLTTSFINQAQLTAELSAGGTTGSGAALIGFDDENVAYQFTNRVDRVVTSIGALRALVHTTYTFAWVTGYYASGDGGGGEYYYDSNDTTSADNGGTIIVATDGARWKLSNFSFLTPLQFGCKGDDSTDDSTSMTKAVATAASSGVWLDGQNKTYKMNVALTVNSAPLSPKWKNLTFDYSASTVSPILIAINGSVGSTVALTSNASIGDVVLNIASTTGIAVDDILWLSSSASWSTVGGVTNMEMVQVKSINSSTQVGLYGKVLYNYTTGNSATVQDFTFVENTILENISIIGNTAASQQGLVLTYCKNARIEKFRGLNLEDRHIEFITCYNCYLNNANFQSATATGLAYGVVIGNGCTNGFITNITASDMRYAVAFGGTIGVSRLWKISDIIGYGMREGVVNTHTGVDYIDFINCYNINPSTSGSPGDGITINGINITLINCDILGALRHGINVNPIVNSNSSVGSYIRLIGCRAVNSGQIGILVENSGTQPLGLVEFKDCYVDTPGVSTNNGWGIYAKADAAAGGIVSLKVQNNTVLNVTTSQGLCLNIIQGDTTNVIAASVISGNHFSRNDDLNPNVQLAGQSANTFSHGLFSGNYLNNGTYGVSGVSCTASSTFASTTGNTFNSMLTANTNGI